MKQYNETPATRWWAMLTMAHRKKVRKQMQLKLKEARNEGDN